MTTTRCSACRAGRRRGYAQDARFERWRGKLHPDVSAEPDAEDRFREVAEAYEVLSDPDTRQRYDRFGHDGLSRSGYRSGAGSADDLSSFVTSFFGGDLFGDLFGGGAQRRGSDVLVEVELALADAAIGVSARGLLHSGRHL